jgi:DNA-binding transcriptional ArsR family regulator
MSAPAVSKHLQVLEQAGLVQQRCNGRHQVGVLRERPVIDAGRWIEAQTAFWSGSLDIRWPGTCPRSRWHACHA